MSEKNLNENLNVNLPFKRGAEYRDGHEDLTSETDLMRCGLYRLLPKRSREYAKKDLHLLEYMHVVPIDKVGIPKFYPKLDAKLRNIERPNLIYPVGDLVYIHIFADEEDTRNYYIPIEPTLLRGVDELAREAEIRMIDYIKDVEVDTVEERKGVLKEALRKVCLIESVEDGGTASINPISLKNTFNLAYLRDKLSLSSLKRYASRLNLPFLRDEGGRLNLPFLRDDDNDKLHVSSSEFKALEYTILRDKIGLGLLHPFTLDPYIEDVGSDGIGQIYVEHKIFGALKSVIEFKREEDLDSFVIKLAEKVGKPITYKNPIVDASLPDGSRLNIVYGKDISLKGSNFSIRKFTEVPFSVLDLIATGTINYEVAAYLWILIENGMSMFFSGETASGKTTTLNAMTTFVPSNYKIVSIEDTPELQLPHPHWTREVSRIHERGVEGGEGKGSDITMFDLLKTSLRQRPNYILVGEVRGIEGNIVFQAIQTGHPVMSTFHAASVEKLVQRITGDPISVPKTFIDNLNAIVLQSAVRRPDGSVVRRVTSINEVVGYNPQKRTVSFVRAFAWDPETDSHVFTANRNSYLLENKIAQNLGIPEERRWVLYNEIEKRTKMLEKMSEKGVTNFYDIYRIITKMQNKGILKIAG
ncbi:MAG: putative flagella-related protein FlaI [Candidatus Methanolliviera sp. GoM_asphalt]|nr:MAG: putative flagella-related protein FlaI [Candidatus Methanolliviera sp. GoM_asphalt]